MRWKSYLITLSVIICLRITDLWLTALYIPDLSTEFNPLVSVLGGSWKALIITQILIVGFTAFLMRFYFARKPVEIRSKRLPFREFLHCYFMGTVDRKSAENIKIDLRTHLMLPPKDPALRDQYRLSMSRHMVFNGWLFMNAVILVSIFAIVHNSMLLLHVRWYIQFVREWYSLYIPMAYLLAIMTSAVSFAVIEYRRYRNL